MSALNPWMLGSFALTKPLEADEIAAIRLTGRVTVEMTRGSSLLHLAEAEGLAEHIRDLSITGTPRSDLRGIERFTSLEQFDAEGIRLDDDVQFPQLRGYGGTVQAAILKAPRLEDLAIGGRIPDEAQPLSVEGPVRTIRFDAKGIRAFPHLRHPQALVEARLWGGGALDVSNLGEATNLKVLWLYGFPDLTGFRQVAALPRLDQLTISMCESLSPLESLLDMPVPVINGCYIGDASPEFVERLRERGWSANSRNSRRSDA